MSYSKFGNLNGISIDKYQITIDKFKGVDLSSAPLNVAVYRSPHAPNMIRDVPGKVRKRLGYHKIGEYAGAINGVYKLDDISLIHAGTKLYNGNTVIYSNMADARGQSWQIDGETYIVDGKRMLVVQFKDNNLTVRPVDEIGTVPLVYANKSPDGSGGAEISPFNLMSAGWKEEFLGDGTSKDYQLLLDELDSTEVKVEILQTSGEWADKKEGTDFTVDRTSGVVKFNTAPEKSPATGASNVRITAYKSNRSNTADIINKCDVSILYGQAGLTNRLFVAGNPNYPNRDYFSAADDRTYFGDTWYSELGQDSNAIVGYSIINDYLAAHKNNGEDGRNIIMRYSDENDMDDLGQVYFRVVNSIQGEGAIGKRNFAFLNEPLFATRRGIYAVTAADITGEKYTQNRSFYINKALEREDLANSYAISWKDYYVLACKERIYLLDTSQREYAKGEPYSNFQYECYYWEIPNVNVMWTDNDVLKFGTTDGKLYEFYTDPDNVAYYNDDGKTIPASWDIPDLDGKDFYKNKTFRYMSVRMAPAINCGFEVWCLSRGIWTKLFDTGARGNYFNFEYIDFSKINFSSNDTPRTVGSKIKVKKVDGARFSIRNENINEPLGIYDIVFEYTQGGNFKG